MQIGPSIALYDLAGPAARLLELAAAKVVARIKLGQIPRHAGLHGRGEIRHSRLDGVDAGVSVRLAILAFDATGDRDLLELGRNNTVEYMSPHVTHVGVHDHGFNNLSTYGNLRRLIRRGAFRTMNGSSSFMSWPSRPAGRCRRRGGRACRWQSRRRTRRDRQAWDTSIPSTARTRCSWIRCGRRRILGLAWQLGQPLMHENDRSANLLKRSILHGLTTSQYILFHGDSGQTCDVRGRTAHEAIFNRSDGNFRCRSTQQGYSPFSTWTRGLAWAMLGYAEELEFFATISDAAFQSATGLARSDVMAVYEQAARATCDHYLNDCAAADGIVYWDDGAPGLAKMHNWREWSADPFNDFEPVDSSASVIAAQGLLRLGRFLGAAGERYAQAGLSIARVLFAEPYLSTGADHQGLLLHSVYHRPNGWDHIPPGRKVPCGESSMWGDYHAIELALMIQRSARSEPYYAFFDS